MQCEDTILEQKPLWQDAYSILDNEDASQLGRFRLKRFLNWLDESKQDWTRPDLEAYTAYLKAHDKHDDTINTTIHEIRQHYLAVLSNPENYAHIPSAKQQDFVNNILTHLGFNIALIHYKNITGNAEARKTENARVIFPSNVHQSRHTILADFVLWLDDTGRHWSKPDLIDYKEYLLKTQGRDALKHGLGVVRARYQEIRDDDAMLSTLNQQQRTAFLTNFRKYLGYMDAFPSKQNPNREMLEDDPSNMFFLSEAQLSELLAQPDTSAFIGLRDRAFLGLAAATAINRFEYGNVMVQHLRHKADGELALFVPESNSYPMRLIPYGDYEWALEWIDEWLSAANITEGAVFRGTYGNRDALRPTGIAPETASDILNRYPIDMGYGHKVPTLFSDIRATVGRRWYETQIPLDDIQDRLALNHRNSLLMLIGLRVRDAFG